MRLISDNKKYYFYAASIFLSRGLEYLILLVAPLVLSKQNYGDFEFYKRAIEFSSTILVFGLPTLMITYSKSNQSKTYLLLFSVLIILFLGAMTAPVLYFINYTFLLIPILFYSLFFSNGILQMYFLVAKGSNAASLFKILVSIIFYFGVYLGITYTKQPEQAFVTSGSFLFPFGLATLGYLIYSLKPKWGVLLKYFSLFKKLLISSATVVISTISNMMFMYSDIFILKLLSPNPSLEIADYSFVLNITNTIILIPMTLVQVDIEKIKNADYLWLKRYRKKNLLSIIVFSVFIVFLYVLLTKTYYKAFEDTGLLFIILFVGKFLQANSVFLGTQILIKKYFLENLKINLMTMLFNIVASYLFYQKLGLLGIAAVSMFSLIIRYILLSFYFNKMQSKK